jgi:chromosome partitioning protein
VLIPVACDYLSLGGVRQVLRTLRNVEKLLGHPVALVGVVPTMYDRRRRMDRQVLVALQERFAGQVAPPIRQNSRVTEAPSHGKTIFEYDHRSNGAVDYRALVSWLGARDWEVADG